MLVAGLSRDLWGVSGVLGAGLSRDLWGGTYASPEVWMVGGFCFGCQLPP